MRLLNPSFRNRKFQSINIFAGVVNVCTDAIDGNKTIIF